MRLDGKLKALRTGNTRMLEAARELQQSRLHAENAVAALRRSADAAGRELQAKIDEARAIATAPPTRRARPGQRRLHAAPAQRALGRRAMAAPGPPPSASCRP